MIKKCLYCGKEFERTSNCHKFCSKICRHRAFCRKEHPKQIRYCLCCGNEIINRNNRAKFCTPWCRYVFSKKIKNQKKSNKEPKMCLICKNEFIPKRNASYCSIKCQNKNRYSREKQMRWCLFCGETFETNIRSKKRCCSRTCLSLKWQKDNPEKVKKYQKITRQRHGRKFKLKYRYGITLEDKKNIVKNQNNKCAICQKECQEKDLYIDHDHKTGCVRGLLCKGCNFGIGYFYDNENLIHNAIKYINKNNDEINVITKQESEEYAIINKCTICGVDFQTLRNAQFCSEKCRRKSRFMIKIKRKCLICWNIINKKCGTKFCSKKCSHKQWSLKNYAKEAIELYGEEIRKHIERLHNGQLKQRYGITLAAKRKIFELQEFKCAICFKILNERDLYVDHEHKTGQIRGLLCLICNNGVGYFCDNQEIMENAIEYLKKNKIKE